MLASGPDVYRTIQRWRDGLEPWFMIEGTLEDDRHYQPSGAEWPAARHWWNCHERRLHDAMRAVWSDAVPLSHLELADRQAGGWPLVQLAPWWCGVEAVKAA